MDQYFYEIMEASPVIAAIKDNQGLRTCCSNKDIKVVFILYGDICNIGSIVESLHKAGKEVIVHIDLIVGLSGKEVAVEYIKNTIKADGIISTRPQLIKKANLLSMITVLRVFALDSMAYEKIEKEIDMCNPDAIEILPGLMPKVIKKICKKVKIPVIAGGLIADKEDVVDALSAGAISVSSTDVNVWNM